MVTRETSSSDETADSSHLRRRLEGTHDTAVCNSSPRFLVLKLLLVPMLFLVMMDPSYIIIMEFVCTSIKYRNLFTFRCVKLETPPCAFEFNELYCESVAVDAKGITSCSYGRSFTLLKSVVQFEVCDEWGKNIIFFIAGSFVRAI